MIDQTADYDLFGQANALLAKYLDGRAAILRFYYCEETPGYFELGIATDEGSFTRLGTYYAVPELVARLTDRATFRQSDIADIIVAIQAFHV